MTKYKILIAHIDDVKRNYCMLIADEDVMVQSLFQVAYDNLDAGKYSLKRAIGEVPFSILTKQNRPLIVKDLPDQATRQILLPWLLAVGLVELNEGAVKDSP